MADLRINCGEGRGNTLCDNCATTQSNKYTVYFNVDKDRFEVEKECVCFNGETKYTEIYASDAPKVG